ncbi:MAG: hypothetical protein ACYS8X_13650 [Planctomycetota bacterium]|jgi:hypothetical protein
MTRTLAIICLIIALVPMSGCFPILGASGGVGGQGLRITINQNAPRSLPDAPANNTSAVTVTITDGGTLENPSVTTTPTAQPAEPQ